MGIIEFEHEHDSTTTRSQLWIHSPVSLTEELVEVLEGLGDVKWVVSPNYEHVKYAREWAERYKDAVMVACPGKCYVQLCLCLCSIVMEDVYFNFWMTMVLVLFQKFQFEFEFDF